MKQLLLIRHAKSSWEDESLDDIDRPLNNRGKKEASLLAQLLKEKELSPSMVNPLAIEVLQEVGIDISKN